VTDDMSALAALIITVAVAWPTAGFGVGVLIGTAIRRADEREGRRR
jgi:type IV secretory pathway TrbD component